MFFWLFGPKWAIFGGYFWQSGSGSKTVLWSAHVVEKLLFQCFFRLGLLILIKFGAVFLLFGALVVEKLLFSILPSIVFFHDDLIFGRFLLLGALMDYF